MYYRLVLGREAVLLGWRLFWRSLRQSSGEVWLVIAAALLAAATMGQSAIDLGYALASGDSPPTQASAVLGLWLSATFLASFPFAIAAGQLSFLRSLLADFALRPISRWQAFVAVQAVWTAGPQALALPSVGIPLLIVLAMWLDGTARLMAIAATFVMLRLPAGLLVIGSRVLSASMGTAATIIGALLAVAAMLWLAAPELVIAWSPPGLVAAILIDENNWMAWTGLGLWTVLVAALEYRSLDLESAPRPVAASRLQLLPPIPATITVVARLGRCSAVLLHGELLRLVRWRRYQLSWLACLFLVIALGIRINEHAGPIRIVFMSLIPVQIGGSALANLFATDRAAFHALLTAPVGLRAVLGAKVLAVLCFSLGGVFVSSAFAVARGAEWPLTALGLLFAAGFFMWTTAIGLVTSVLFPSASDPQTVGGALVSTPAFVAVALGGGVYLGAAIGVAYMLERRLWSWPVGSLAALALVVAAALTMRLAWQRSPQLLAVRQEVMLSTLVGGRP